MTDLVDAYQRREVHLAEKILKGLYLIYYLTPQLRVFWSKDNRSTIMDDNFIRSYIGELLRSLRTQYLIDLIKPYTRLELSFLAKVRFFKPLTFYVLTIHPATQCWEGRSWRSPNYTHPRRQGRRTYRSSRDEAGAWQQVSPRSRSNCAQLLIISLFRQSLEKKRYAALNKWTEALESVHTAVVGKTATVRGPDPGIEGVGIREEMWTWLKWKL